MSNGENGGPQAPAIRNTEIVKPNWEKERAEAETLKFRLETEEINRRLNRKWYDSQSVASKLISALVGIALAATYFIGLIEPLRQREKELQLQDIRVLRQKNERIAETLEAANLELRVELKDVELRATERQSLLEKLSGEYGMLGQKAELSERERSHFVELARTATEEVETLQQEILALRAAQDATQARSQRIREHIRTEWQTVLVTVLGPDGKGLSGIYLDRVAAGAIKNEPLEHSTDDKGRKYVRVRKGDKVCTQETDKFRSACRTIEPDTTETTLILERK